MNYLRVVRVEHVWEHAGIDWRRALPGGGLKNQPLVWTLATPVRDPDVQIVGSKLYKSIRDECDEASKKSSLLIMLNQLSYAIRHHDYQGILKGTPVDVKEAFGFNYRNQKRKVWELKYQNKDRLYFFTHSSTEIENARLLLPLIFHHKRDKTTPTSICDHCERAMKPFLDLNPKFKILKETP